VRLGDSNVFKTDMQCEKKPYQSSKRPDAGFFLYVVRAERRAARWIVSFVSFSNTGLVHNVLSKHSRQFVL